MSLWKLIFGASWGTSTIGYVFGLSTLAWAFWEAHSGSKPLDIPTVMLAAGFAGLGRVARQTNVSSEETRAHRRKSK